MYLIQQLRLEVLVNALLKLVPLAAVAFAAALAVGEAPVAAGGGGCHGASSPPEATGDTVLLQEHCFAPNVLRVAPGTQVMFRNNDATEHHISGVAMRWSSNGMLGEGDTANFTFDAPGTYPYTCYLHGGMSGAIVVGDGAFAEGQPAVAVAVPRTEPRIAPKAVADQAPGDSPVTAAAVAPPTRGGDDNPFLFAALGALIGAVTVSVAVAAKGMRRDS